MTEIAGCQLNNPDPAAAAGVTLAEARDGLWGYRFSRQSANVLQADTVGPVSAFNGNVVLPGLVESADISTQNAMNNAAASTGATVASSVSTIFGVYWCAAGVFAGGFGFSTAAPVIVDGLPLLNSSGDGLNCLFLGWIRTSAAGALVDTVQDRHVVNWWNRRRTFLYVNPGYVNDNAQTTYSRTLNVWGAVGVTAGASTVSFIGTGLDSAEFRAHLMLTGAPVAYTGFGIGLSTTQPEAVASIPANAPNNGSCAVSYQYIPTSGALASVTALLHTNNNATAVVADVARTGAAADPPATAMWGSIWA